MTYVNGFYNCNFIQKFTHYLIFLPLDELESNQGRSCLHPTISSTRNPSVVPNYTSRFTSEKALYSISTCASRMMQPWFLFNAGLLNNQ